MRKISMLIILALISFFGFVTTACNDDDGTTPVVEQKNGSLTFNFSSSQEILESLSISKIVIKLEKSVFSDSLELSADAVSGEFTSIKPGTYTITVTAYNGDKVEATGTDEITVEAGKVTDSVITLQYVNGNIDIVIEWDDLALNAPKYIFFFIGDGMAMPQINATEAATGVDGFGTLSETPSFGTLNMNFFPVIGMQTTHAEDRYITGSAASATALATGYKTSIGTISMNSAHNMDYTTMAEMAKAKGMKVGIVSSVSIDHATPAAFYAHTSSRNNYEDIGNFLANSGFDYFAGGNIRFNKYGSSVKESSSIELEDLAGFQSLISSKGYTYVSDKATFDALTSTSGKVFATLNKLNTYTSDGSAMPYQIDIHLQDNDNDKITLADFTEKGIELLDNEDGFFMMVEGGKVDWACHANDAVSAIYDMIAFDDAIGKAIEFYNDHKDETLIIVTGDHECGGLTLGYANTGYETWFQTLKHQNVSFLEFASHVSDWKDAGNVTFTIALEYTKQYFGLGNTKLNSLLALSSYDSTRLEQAFNSSMTGKKLKIDEEHSLLYGTYDPYTVTVTHILNEKAGLTWTSYSHTGVPVPVLALGKGQSVFNGYYDNTDIGKKIIEVGDLD